VLPGALRLVPRSVVHFCSVVNCPHPSHERLLQPRLPMRKTHKSQNSCGVYGSDGCACGAFCVRALAIRVGGEAQRNPSFSPRVPLEASNSLFLASTSLLEASNFLCKSSRAASASASLLAVSQFLAASSSIVSRKPPSMQQPTVSNKVKQTYGCSHTPHAGTDRNTLTR